MPSNEISGILREGISLENKLKEFLAENEKNKEEFSIQEQEISAEHEQSKEETETFDLKLTDLFDEWKKIGLSKDKIIAKQKELIKEIKRKGEEQNRIYIKEYTELHTITVRQKREIKEWAERIQKQSQIEVKKAKRLAWIAGVVVGLVSVVLTALACYIMWGKK